MPIKPNESLIRKFQLKVMVQNGEAEPREETLTIKHRPVTDEWLDRWAETAAREQQSLQAELDKIQKKADELEKRREEEGAEDIDQDEALKVIEEARASLTEKRQKSFLVRQMADLLIDIDHVDGEGRPIPPTEEFLYTMDRAFLEEIKEGIEKKLGLGGRRFIG